MQAAVAEFGGVDLLVNNAGLFSAITRAPFDQLAIEEWRRVLDVNVTGVFLFSRAVVTHMRAAGRGGDRQHLLGDGLFRAADDAALRR